MRKPIVAGQFYPENKVELKKEVNGYIKKKEDSKIIGAIVPHAGYTFSGKCAGEVYSVIPKADSYIIIGTNHSSRGVNIAISLDDFETPFGVVKNDKQLGEEILKNLNFEPDSEAHEYEHSIEVQLPFLQQSQKNFKMVPIILGNYNLDLCRKLAEAIDKANKKLKRKIILIASSDFTHSGPSYGARIDIQIDKEAINKILKLDINGFINVAKTTTICGTGAICTVIEFAKLSKIKQAKLLDYYDSSQILPNENKVGYAGIVFLL